MHRFERRLSLPIPRRQLFAWHARPGAFERLAPSWAKVEVLEREGSITDGDRLRFRVGGLLRWHARHENYDPPREFEDVAERSPFASWRHTHSFAREERGGVERSRLCDHVEYRLPLDALSWPLLGRRVEAELERMFLQRHLRTANDLRRHREFADRGPQRVAISGSSGLVGSALKAFLTTGGHEVLSLVRGEARERGELRWLPGLGVVDREGLERTDAVVHLAGESIMGRWTKDKRAAIRRSRIEGTRRLCESLATLEYKPRVLICASATGYYGDGGEAELDERAPAGEGFLAEVAREWEAATEPAKVAGIRVVHLRLGMVLSGSGGALGAMRVPFGLGLGGPIGGGRQWQSWIDLDDLLGVILHAIHDTRLAGAVNAVAPTPVRQAEFADTLGEVLRRPAFLPLPAGLLRLALGELGDELLLASQRVRPSELERCGFSWDFPELEDSLRHQLGRARPELLERAVAKFEAQLGERHQAA